MLLFDSIGKLRIELLCDFAHLTPNIGRCEGHSSQTREEAAIYGNVVLSLNKPAKLNKIVVELLGRQEVRLKEIYHAYDVIKRTLTLKTGQEVLPAGDHTFAFVFDVPSETAPWELCKYGRTYHKVTARAVGPGLLVADLEAEEKIGFVSSHAETRGIPPGMHLSSKKSVDQLGTIGFAFSTPYLLHGGKLRLELDIFAPEEAQHAVQLEELRVELEQAYNLHSLQEPQRVDEPPVEYYPLWSSKERGLLLPVLAAGQQFHLDRHFVLPDDKEIRSSTPIHARTGIRISHKLALVVRFIPLSALDGKAKVKTTRIALPATMWLCFCAVEALQLPSYGSDPEAVREVFRMCDKRLNSLYD